MRPFQPVLKSLVRLSYVGIGVCLFNVSLQADPPSSVRSDSWPHWRGPLGNGVAPEATPPIKWSSRQNVVWKTKIPGEGSATPIIWGDRVFVISAVPTDRPAPSPVKTHPESRTKPPGYVYQFQVYCLDRATGEIVWQKTARETSPGEGKHSTNTYASGSPTTDGRRLYVSFGSNGLFCFDLDGNLLWEKDLGQMRTRRGWGEAVTPVIHDETLIVNWDHEDDSYILALDAATGTERWRRQRDEKTSWNTPAVTTYNNQTQVIVNGTTRVRSYDLASGDLIWECGGQTVNPIPSPIVVDDFVVCMSGYRGSAAMAIPLTSKGDVTDGDSILWSHPQSTPYVPSPIVYQGQVYFNRTNVGILTALRVEDGEVVFGPQRLPGINNIYASPVAAQGRIYITGRDGTVLVIGAGNELKVLATNPMDEPIDASPALVDDQLFLRTAQHVYCIQETTGK